MSSSRVGEEDGDSVGKGFTVSKEDIEVMVVGAGRSREQ